MGESLADLRASGIVPDRVRSDFVAVKEAVLPWNRFPGEDTILGPEMRATGEVMGVGITPGEAYAKALLAAGHEVPRSGTVFLSLADRDKELGREVAANLADLGYRILATHGTAGHLARLGIPATHVDKVGDGPWDPVRLIEEGRIDLVVNTPRGRRARGDGRLIRQAANRHDVPCVTTIQGGLAVSRSLLSGEAAMTRVASLQEHHRQSGRP